MSIRGQSVSDVSLNELLLQHKADIFQSMHICKPGFIDSYDPVKGTAVVQIHQKRTFYDGTNAQFPLITDCPVFTLQGGSGGTGVGGVHLSFPILKGDECLVFFADANIDLWFQNGKQPSIPFDGRQHNLSDAFVLVGLNSLVNPRATSLLPTEGGISDGVAKIAIDKITHAVTLAGVGISMSGGGPSTVGIDGITQDPIISDGIAEIRIDSISHKIKIDNATRNLNTVLQSLIANIASLTTLLTLMTPASILAGTTQLAIFALLASFATDAADLGELLE